MYVFIGNVPVHSYGTYQLLGPTRDPTDHGKGGKRGRGGQESKDLCRTTPDIKFESQSDAPNQFTRGPKFNGLI